MISHNITITEIDKDKIQPDILASFNHRQVICKRWQYECEWKTVDCLITRQWDSEKRADP